MLTPPALALQIKPDATPGCLFSIISDMAIQSDNVSNGGACLRSWNDASEIDASYSRISICALIALFFSLCSFLSLLTIWFGFLSLVGFILALLSLAAIYRSDGEITGKVPAFLALSLSIISIIGVGVFWVSYQYGVARESDRFAKIWFNALQTNNIPLAKGLSSYYWSRPSIESSEKWWQDQYENGYAHRSLHNYLDSKVVRVLLALGDKASVKLYKTLDVASSEGKDFITGIYAVNYPDADGKTETFFIKVRTSREYPRGDVTAAGWTLAEIPSFIVPEEFQQSAVSPSSGVALTIP